MQQTPSAPTPSAAAKPNIPLICGGHSRPVPHLSYSGIVQEGAEQRFYLISACLDGKPMLRNGQTGDWIGTFVGHKGAVWAASLTENALLAATGSADYTSKIWDAITGECKQSFEHKRIVKTVDFSKEGTRLLTAGQEKILRIFDLLNPTAAPQVLTGHTESVKIAQWLTENTIISGGSDNALRVWDVRQGKEARNVPAPAAINSLEISRDGKTITMTSGKGVFFVDAANFAITKSFSFGMDLNTACLHPSGSRFVVGGSADFYDHVCDAATGKEIEVHKGHHGPVHCVKYAPDGETFASGSEDGTVRLIQNEVRPYGLWQLQDLSAPAEAPAAAAAAPAPAVAAVQT